MKSYSSRLNKQISIDRLSFQLGMINCFVEMVACGVKRLALSPPLIPEDYQKIAPYSDQIVQRFSVKSYLEQSLLVTKLQSQEFTKGKWSLLYYKTDDVLKDYLNLKKRKIQLERDKKYDQKASEKLSREFMKLLSYPSEVIEEKISGSSQDPYMLIEI
ncbi:MAG: hypothetical protein ACOC6P_01620 [Candidatus Aminicenantaceae bacterium]